MGNISDYVCTGESRRRLYGAARLNKLVCVASAYQTPYNAAGVAYTSPYYVGSRRRWDVKVKPKTTVNVMYRVIVTPKVF